MIRDFIEKGNTHKKFLKRDGDVKNMKSVTLDEAVKLGIQQLQSQKFGRAKEIFEAILRADAENFTARDNLGMIATKMLDFDKAIYHYNQALNLRPGDQRTHFNLATAHLSYGNFHKALELLNLMRQSKFMPHLVSNNIGLVHRHLNNHIDAIASFEDAIAHKNDFSPAYQNLIRELTFVENPPSLKTYALSKLQRNINTYFESIDRRRSASNILFELFNDCIPELLLIGKVAKFHPTQAFRRVSKVLACKRHFTVFKKHSIIPKFCHSCFKIQINVTTFDDLVSIFIMFDKSDYLKSYIRKSIVETRQSVKGSYKAFVYCGDVNEAKSIYDKLQLDCDHSLKHEFNILIKRGCSEFKNLNIDFESVLAEDLELNAYPERNWIIEERFDTEYGTAGSHAMPYTHSGISILDLLVIMEWIHYAKAVGDSSVEKFNALIELDNPTFNLAVSRRYDGYL